MLWAHCVTNSGLELVAFSSATWVAVPSGLAINWELKKNIQEGGPAFELVSGYAHSPGMFCLFDYATAPSLPDASKTFALR